MGEGFIFDHVHEASGTQAEWVEGAPQRSFWTGLKHGSPRKVTTFCCPKCGFLESYAETEAE